MSSIILYGIKNCDSVKKTRGWLDRHLIKYTFHDFRVDGIKKSTINEFLKNIDIKILINKRGTSWRKLSNREKKTSTKSEIIDLLFCVLLDIIILNGVITDSLLMISISSYSNAL